MATAARLQVILTVGKILPLGIIIVGGIVKLAQGIRIISDTLVTIFTAITFDQFKLLS